MEPRAKELLIRVRSAAPSAAELALINAEFSLEPLTAEQLYCRQIALCNDQYDRTGERFPAGYLQRFAETLPGKPLLAAHNKQQLPLGRFYAAAVEPDAQGALWLQTQFYVLRTPGNQELRDQVDAGVYSNASIGFRWADLLCDLCSKSYLGGPAESYCPHVIGREYDGRRATATYGGDLTAVEAIEGSLVYLGAQYGAAVSKDERQPAAKNELEADGAAYRQWLRTETLRLATCTRSRPEAEALLAAKGQAPASELAALLAIYQDRFDREFPAAAAAIAVSHTRSSRPQTAPE